MNSVPALSFFQKGMCFLNCVVSVWQHLRKHNVRAQLSLTVQVLCPAWLNKRLRFPVEHFGAL